MTRVRRGAKTYEYAQLVESYRRESDGLPVHRVLASLGQLEPQQFHNLRVALEASRKGKQVVIPEPLERSASIRGALKPDENLRYLDVAVLLELWRDWGLGEILDDLMPTGDSNVAPSAVVAALTIQRVVDPRSKLYAQRWFPRTALPELLDIPQESFNNTRLHRVLEDLDHVTPALMKRLPRTYIEREGAFASMFLDVTDTWFVGHGPQMAERGKTKEGFVREKIGIVLLCNTQGYPLRWKVIPGKQSDGVAMVNMFRSIQGLRWLGEAPVVCDRAMGNTAHIRKLLASEVRFLTALTLTEFGAYTDRIPHQAFAGVDPVLLGDAEEQQRVEAGRLAEAAGMKKVFDDLFVLDLGVVERPGDEAIDGEAVEVDSKIEGMRLGREIKEAVDAGRADTYRAAGRALGVKESQTSLYVQLCRLPEELQEEVLDGAAVGLTLSDLVRISRMKSPERQRAELERLAQKVDPTVEAMRFGRSIQRAVANDESSSYGAAGEALGLKPSVTSKYLNLCKLPEEVQQAVLAGQAVGVCLKDLLLVSAIEQPKRQREDFDRLVQEAVFRSRARPNRTLCATDTKTAASGPIRVRAVAFFNPDLFINQRCRAKQHLDEIQRFADKLNARLASPHSRRAPAKLTAEVETKLRGYNLIDAYEVEITQKEIWNRSRYQVQLTLNAEEWARRRRYDGFCLLVAHPDVSHAADELCRLYRAKDAVEKDFEVIKSVVKIRPVRHHTDAKVRAHVTLCMLALLLERTLKQRLGGKWTSGAALELLADRCLNRYGLANGTSVYTVTKTTSEQEAILRALQLQHLTNDDDVADRIRPR